MNDEVNNLGEPLTLEQLRGMDGYCVWVESLRGDFESRMREISLVGNTVGSMVFDMVGDRRTKIVVSENSYGAGWLAYRYQSVATDTDVGSKDINVPTSINLDAWEPCDECRNKCCFNCLYDNLSMQSEPCNSCDGDKWETKHLFCPNCGRPLTPEACAMQEKRLRGRK